MKRITMLNGGRFISRHLGATVYCDNRHQVLEIRCQGGVTMELVREYQPNGTRCDQMLSVYGGRSANIIEWN